MSLTVGTNRFPEEQTGQRLVATVLIIFKSGISDKIDCGADALYRVSISGHNKEPPEATA